MTLARSCSKDLIAETISFHLLTLPVVLADRNYQKGRTFYSESVES